MIAATQPITVGMRKERGSSGPWKLSREIVQNRGIPRFWSAGMLNRLFSISEPHCAYVFTDHLTTFAFTVRRAQAMTTSGFYCCPNRSAGQCTQLAARISPTNLCIVR
jgi:hypothetical protein